MRIFYKGSLDMTRSSAYAELSQLWGKDIVIFTGKYMKNKQNDRLFTAQCTKLVQSAVLRSHVVRLSVTLVICDQIRWSLGN